MKSERFYTPSQRNQYHPFRRNLVVTTESWLAPWADCTFGRRTFKETEPAVCPCVSTFSSANANMLLLYRNSKPCSSMYNHSSNVLRVETIVRLSGTSPNAASRPDSQPRSRRRTQIVNASRAIGARRLDEHHFDFVFSNRTMTNTLGNNREFSRLQRQFPFFEKNS